MIFQNNLSRNNKKGLTTHFIPTKNTVLQKQTQCQGYLHRKLQNGLKIHERQKDAKTGTYQPEQKQDPQ